MLADWAARNLRERLAECTYPGRGIVIGRNGAGQWVQVYWIMGRSANSRNRLFVCDDGDLRTQAADATKVTNPALVIYCAMRRHGHCFIVANGAQTDAVHGGLARGRSFVESLSDWEHEPDAPNYTPRISGLTDLSQGHVWLSVIRASYPQPAPSDHAFYRYAHVEPGFGYAVTTYTGDGDPLPSFTGEPYLVPLRGDAAQVATAYWEVLDADNRVAVAVRQIEPRTGEARMEIVNRHQPAGG